LRSSQSPKAFLFDIGNVLVRWDPVNLYRHLFVDAAHLQRTLQNRKVTFGSPNPISM